MWSHIVLAGVLVLVGICSAKRCDRMTVSEMCLNMRQCKHHILDLKTICRNMRKDNKTSQEIYHFKKQGLLDNRASDVISIIKSFVVPFDDATVPLILEGPKNITVAPGGEIFLSCLVEGAPTPDVMLSRREDSYIEKPEVALGNSIELSISKVVHKQVDVLQSDEGWYRCVGVNSEGGVYADAYVTVRDLCAEMDPPCPSTKICEADYDLQITECVCPSCEDEDFTGEWVCGTNCASYFSKCSLDEDNCYEDTSYTVFKKSYCPEFTAPVFTVTPATTIETEYKESITLSCAAEPAGIQPGPPPIISWYDEYNDLIGEGNSLLLTPEDDMIVTCVAHHCPNGGREEKVLQTDPVMITIKQARSNYHDGKSCQVFGDPHIITFDGTAYTHEGACDYVLAMDCMAATWFVYGRFTQCGTGMSCLLSVTLFYGYDVVLELQRGWLVNSNGEKIPIKLGQLKSIREDVMLLFDGEWLTLTFGENEIRWDGLMNMQLLIAPTAGRTCGLCGNNNGVMGDEFVLRRSSYGVGNTIGRFLDSWRLDNDGLCQLEGDKDEMVVQESEVARIVCSSLFSGDYVKQCVSEVDNEVYLEACVRDYTVSEYKRAEYRIECSILQSYVQRCASKGVDLSDWREQSSCTNISKLQNFVLAQGCPQEVSPLS